MFPISLARAVAAAISAALLLTGVYFLWSWGEGTSVRDPSGAVIRVREDWRLATGGALMAWSFFGGVLAPFLLARGGGRPTKAIRGDGVILAGASGASLYVERYGPAGAPIILFTHGWGMDSTFWDYARQDLGERFHLVLWDLPGLGRSKVAPGRSIDLSDFAADLEGLLARLERPAVVVGHSIGGMIIQTLARDRPEALSRIAGIVLLNTTFTNPLKTMVFSRVFAMLQRPLLEPVAHLTIWLHPLVWISKWQSYLSGSTHLAMRLGFGRSVSRSQLRHATLLATRAPPAIEARGDLAMFHWDARCALRGLRAPLLVIGGDLDIVTKLEASEEIAGETPTGRLQVVEGANHMGPLERADLYNEAIAAFTRDVQSAVAQRSA